MPILAAAGTAPDYWPFAVLAISVALILLLITKLKSWTVVVSVNSVVGLIVCLIFSKLVPLAQQAM